jgi:hypothetical protein
MSGPSISLVTRELTWGLYDRRNAGFVSPRPCTTVRRATVAWERVGKGDYSFLLPLLYFQSTSRELRVPTFFGSEQSVDSAGAVVRVTFPRRDACEESEDGAHVVSCKTNRKR